ncbi:MAG: hypothetical protein P4K83_05840 [Terracidiphilus sp.]|nr:hypothetical protein [Terracidiphilus sp.]
MRAKRGHVTSSKLPPIGKHGGQRSPDLTGSQLQKSMTGATRERLPQPLRDHGVQDNRTFLLSQ